MKTVDFLKKYVIYSLAATGMLFTSCNEDDGVAPPDGNSLEEITDVKLIFTNKNDSTDVVTALAEDKDGDGVGSVAIVDNINLGANKTYELTFEILNKLAEDEDDHDAEGDTHVEEDAHVEGDTHTEESTHTKEDPHTEDDDHDHDHDHGYNIGEQIEEEKEEHQFFFGFTNNAFKNPIGNGNIDNASDPINYEDKDANNRYVGLKTTWTTGAALKGTFTVLLKHQTNGIKTDTSTSDDGETDFKLEFVLNIE